MSTAQAQRGTRKLGSFEILEQIAEGGMGVVLLAQQPALERLVVLKKIRRDLLVDPRMIERFQREARAAAAVQHQNVVAVYDCFTNRGDHFIAQEYVDGEDLRTVLQRIGRFRPRVAALIGLELARGLEEVHSRGIVHRDLKPANILLGSGGEAKIADFGIALEGAADGLTRPGTLMGSLPYMSPEHLLGERVDYRSDIFLFGILLYEMITGVPPFRESEDNATDTLLERMQNRRYTSPRKIAPAVPRYMVRLIRSCLRARPAKRFQTATELRRCLERRLGRVSAVDCRSEIAQFLFERGLIRRSDDQTTPRPTARSAVPWWRGPRRRLILGAALGLPAAVLLTVFLSGVLSGFGAANDPDREVSPAARSAVGIPAPEPPDIDPATPAVLDRGPVVRAGLEPVGLPIVVPPAPAPDPAQLRFVAYPWAEVRIDGEPAFYTPRAAPVALAPGTHRVVFEHPLYGSKQIEVDVQPGEQRTIRHLFAETSSP